MSANLVMVHMTISAWTGERKAKKFDKELEVFSRSAGSEADAVTLIKKLLPPSYRQPIVQITDNIRKYWDALTLPWEHAGWDVVRAEKWSVLMDNIAKLKLDYVKLIDQMCQPEEYEKIKAFAKKRLGRLYTEGEFPTAKEMRAKYNITVESRPLIRPEDVRVAGVTETEEKKIRGDYEAEFNNKIKELETGVLDALQELLTEVDTRIKVRSATGDQKGVRYGSLQRKAKKLAEQLHNMNVNGDVDVAVLIDETIDVLTKADPERLRESEEARVVIGKQAGSLLSQLKGFGKAE